LPNGGTLDVMNPSAIRDILDAETVIDCIVQLAVRRATGVVNIGSGHGMSVQEIAQAVARQLGKTITVTGTDRDAAGSLIADTRRLQQLIGA
jgi:nucleoside-diphosphate-sugar epimerase